MALFGTGAECNLGKKPIFKGCFKMQIQGSVLLAKELAEDGLCMYSEARDHEREECGEINKMSPVSCPRLSHPLTPCSLNIDFAWLCNGYG